MPKARIERPMLTCGQYYLSYATGMFIGDGYVKNGTRGAICIGQATFLCQIH